MMLARYSQSNFVEVFMSLSGVIVGPVLGLFTLGVFVPWANAKVYIFYYFKIIYSFLNNQDVILYYILLTIDFNIYTISKRFL